MCSSIASTSPASATSASRARSGWRAAAAGSLAASIAFSPPEVLDGGRPGVAGDVYSLGASLHALLSGHAPFVRSTATASPGRTGTRRR